MVDEHELKRAGPAEAASHRPGKLPAVGAEDDLQSKVARLEDNLIGLQDEIVRLQQINRVMSRRLKDATDNYHLLTQSAIWRLAAPVRMAGRRAPRLARAARGLVGRLERGVRALYRLLRAAIAGLRWRDVPRSIPAGRFAATDMLTPDLLRSFPDSEARSAANTIFVAADMIPMFDKHAGALRLFNLLRIMNELGWRTVFASALDLDPFEAAAGSLGDRERYERALRDIGVSEIAYGGAGSDRLLESVGSDLRWAFLSFPMVAKQLIPRVRLRAPQAKIIYDMVDFHAVRMEREARVKSDPAIQAAADRMRAIELVNARTADLAIAVSETDRRLLLGADPAFRIEIIPTIHDTPPLAVSDIGNRRGLFFVGGFLHAPNRDGIVWFAREVWPLIRGEVPDATLAIAGSNVPNEVLSLGSIPGVEIVGFVPDLTELFNRARVFVAPLRFGAGVSGKIGQSLARGLPVVTTRIGAEGMPLQDKEHALIADTPQDFAAAVVRLLRDDALWVRLQANGRALIERTQSIDHIRNIVGSLLSG